MQLVYVSSNFQGHKNDLNYVTIKKNSMLSLHYWKSNYLHNVLVKNIFSSYSKDIELGEELLCLTFSLASICEPHLFINKLEDFQALQA